MMLASNAFRELPAHYATQQGVLRFCLGLSGMRHGND